MNRISSSLLLGITISLQLLLFYLLVFFLPLLPAFYLSFAIVFLAASVWAKKNPAMVEWNGRDSIFPFAIVLIYFIKIYFAEIAGWDSRSIWLFHTKVIYLANGFTEKMGWSDASVSWAHMDYPNLGPALGAFFIRSGGDWNELASRFSWFVISVPPILFLHSTLGGFFGKWFQVFCYLFVGSVLYTGYMDGYLAMYTLCAFIFMIRFLESGLRSNFFLTLLCLAVVVNLKNEGVLIAISMGLPLMIFGYRRLKPVDFFSFALFLPLLNWIFYKKNNQIVSEFKFLSAETMERLMGRLSDGKSIAYVVRSMFFYERKIFYTLIVLILYFVGMKIFQVKMKRSVKIGFASVLLYTAGLIFVYLSTPYDLDFHMRYSVGRITLGLDLMVYFLLYFNVKREESRSGISLAI